MRWWLQLYASTSIRRAFDTRSTSYQRSLSAQWRHVTRPADPLAGATLICLFIMPPPLIGGSIKRWCCPTSVCLSDVCKSVAYIGPKSRTEVNSFSRFRNTKIGTEVAHVTRDSDTTFKVKRSRSPGRFTHRGFNASGSCSGERGNLLGVGNYCYVAMCSAALGASAPTEGGEGRGHIVAATRLQLV